MAKISFLAVGVVILFFVTVAKSAPTPTPIAVGPTPTQSPVTETKEQLISRVEAAFAAVKNSRASGIRLHEAEVRLLQVQVEAFKNRATVPDSKLEALKSEAEQIIQECNILRDEKRPAFWSNLLGYNLADYLMRAAAVLVLGMLAVVIMLIIRMRKEGKDLRLAIEDLQQGVKVLKTPPATQSETLKTDSEDLKSFDNQLENVRQEVQTLKQEWITSLDKLRQAVLPEELQDAITIPPEEGQEDVRKVAQNAYVKDVIRAVPEDCQVTARYSVGHSSFVPDTSGELVVLLNDSVSDLAIILPKTGWLSSPDQFYTHYQEAYNCEQPNIGSMFILTPAVVEKDNDRWKLTEQGTLELRG